VDYISFPTPRKSFFLKALPGKPRENRTERLTQILWVSSETCRFAANRPGRPISRTEALCHARLIRRCLSSCQLSVVSWLAVGCWQGGSGSWQLAVGRWQLRKAGRLKTLTLSIFLLP